MLIQEKGVFKLNLDYFKFHKENSVVSPYYIICLLWYPCFENLFSIVRKKINKATPQESDNNHLHHLIYSELKSQKKSKITRSNLAGFIIFFQSTAFL